MSQPVTVPSSTSTTRLLSANDVAERLRVRRPRVYALMRDAGLPAPVRLHGRSSRWIESEIEQWIAARPRAGRATEKTNAPAVAAEASSSAR